MKSMIVKLTWDDDDLGPEWMNPSALELLLYNKWDTRRDLLTAEVLNPEAAELVIMNALCESALYEPGYGVFNSGEAANTAKRILKELGIS